jgi:hypothetical protein
MNHRNAIYACISELHAMNRTNKLPLLKAIPLLGTFSLGVLFLVCAICINESSDFLPAFATYIDSGRSLFIPDLPRIDLLWLLPPEQQFIPLTWGHIIDIVIFINIGLALNKIPYDCYRRASESRLAIQIVDLHLDSRSVKIKAGNMFDGKCSMPCIDARTSLRSHAKREAEHVDQASQFEELGMAIVYANGRKISQREPRRSRMALLARQAFLTSCIFSSSLINEDCPRSGSCFSSKSSLHSYFQEFGVYPL